MNDKEILMEKDAEQEKSSRAPRRSIYGAIIAAAVCVVLALVVWIGVMNTQDTDFIPVRVEGGLEGYTYELSVDGVEVEGKVALLRQLDEIVIELKDEDVMYILSAFGGSASVNEAILGLPEGVYLTREFAAVLTVKAK